MLIRFFGEHCIEVRNVAGPRASKERQIAEFVEQTFEKALLQAGTGAGN